MVMSWPAGPARRASAAKAMAILLGGLILLSLVVERSPEESSPATVPAVGGRRRMIGINGELGNQRKRLEEFGDDDPFSGSKRRVPNGPDPIHNRGAGESGRSPGRA